MNQEPRISVGILSAPEINIVLLDSYMHGDKAVRGPQTFEITPDGRIAWQGMVHDSIDLVPAGEKGAFEIADVVIGVNFHWERRETQRFPGACRVIVEGDRLTIINILPVEEYLLSVISSEMSAHASLELLKAHAVISRSWLLAQIEKDKSIRESSQEYSAETVSDDELVKWYDRQDHVNFDVCADDHCQRYQGLGRRTTAAARAVDATRGIVLTYGDEICDARFSKCCGGRTERFDACWEDASHPYLEAIDDPYCLRATPEVLATVLNSYDREQPGFCLLYTSPSPRDTR